MLDSSAPKTVFTATNSDTDACATHCSCSDKSAEHARSTAEASQLNTTAANNANELVEQSSSDACGCGCGCGGASGAGSEGDMSNIIDGQCHFEGMTDEAVALEIEQRLVAGGSINGAEALYCM